MRKHVLLQAFLACSFASLYAADPVKVAAPDASDEAELAKQTNNPVAALISVPFQSNLDFGIGSAKGVGSADSGAAGASTAGNSSRYDT